MESSTEPMEHVAAARHLRARLRFKHLDLLVALGQSPNLHRASNALSMTQSAASKLLREIELMLGVRLFERTRKGVTATASGVALIERARLLLGLLDGARDEIAAIEGGATGRVRLGIAAVAAPVLLPRAMKLLRAHAPGVVLTVREGGPEMLDELRNGDLDCVIGRIADGDEGIDLSVKRLYQESIVIVGRPGHPLARSRRKVDWPRALSFDWVLPPPGAPIRRALQIWFAHNNLTLPQSRFESVSVLANIAVLQDSEALALLPSRIAQRYADLGLVRVVPLPLPISLPSVALIQRRGDAPSVAASAFATALHDASAASRGRPRLPAAAMNE